MFLLYIGIAFILFVANLSNLESDVKPDPIFVWLWPVGAVVLAFMSLN